MRIRAAVVEKKSEPLLIEDLELIGPRPDEVLVTFLTPVDSR